MAFIDEIERYKTYIEETGVLKEKIKSVADKFNVETELGVDTPSSLLDKIIETDVGGGEDMLQARVDAQGNCDYLFYNYTGDNVDYISKLNTKNSTSFDNMFYSAQNITSVPIFDTSNATSMARMFYNANKLTSVPLFDTSNVTDMSEVFYACSKLKELPPFNTKKVENFYRAFSGCIITQSPALDTSGATSMNSMFHNCLWLTICTGYDTSKVTNFNSMFNTGRWLETVELDLISATNVSNMFGGCSALANLTLKNIKLNISVGSGTSWGHLLTVDSLVNTIKELWDYSSGETTYTLTMGTTNTAKLADVYVKLITPTAEMIEADPYIESKMPCEVCESTDEGAMLITDYATLKNWVIA